MVCAKSGPADSDAIAVFKLFREAGAMRQLAAILLLLSLGACSEQIEESYPTWSDAKSAGAVARGWIPSFVPETARDIKDSHDLDRNTQRLEFSIRSTEVATMVAGFRRISAEDRRLAAELAQELGLGVESDAYVVCSRIQNGVLVVNREEGKIAYDTTIRWADDDCLPTA